MSAQTTATLTAEMMTYYESKFLERSQYELIHGQGFQKNTHKKGNGKVIYWNRYTPLAVATTALTEGTNPAEVDMTGANVSATLAEYGNVTKVAKLLNLTSVDKDGKEKADVMGQNMGETIDTLDQAALYAGATAQLGGGHTALTDVATSDTLSATEVRKAIKTLKINKAMPYADGFFLGKVGPYTSYNLFGDTTWVNAHSYKDGAELYKGELGKLYGVRFIETKNQKTESSTVSVYSNFIHGANAVGGYDLEGDTPKLYIKIPNSGDTSNPTDRYSTISWAGTYVAKVLVAAWVLNIKLGTS